MLRWDVRLQVRYGFYAVYAVIVTAFTLGLTQVPSSFRATALVLVLMGDPAFLGFYFIAALVLFEKREGVVDALTLSPLSGVEYLASKTLSLTLLALLASSIVAVFGYGLDFAPLPFLVGIVLTSALFVLVGFIAVARFDDLNAYFMTPLVYLLPTSLPMLDYLGLVENSLVYLVPTQASLVLIDAAFRPAPTWELAYGVGYLSLSVAVAAVFARRAFERHIVQGLSSGTSESGAARGSIVGRGRSYGPVVSLAIADLKNWLRDPMLAFFAAVPLFYAVLGRLAVPYVADLLAPGFELTPYYPLVLGVFLFLAPLTFGFVTGFFILEERDQNVLAALLTTPLTGRGYLLYRSISVTVVTFALMFLTVPLVGLLPVPVTLLVGICAVGSLWTFACALLLSAFASNTVEGVAVSKFFGLTVMVPVVGVLVAPEPWQFFAGVFPAYWPLKAFLVGVDGGSTVAVVGLLAVGVAAHLVVIGAFVRRFRV